MSMFTEVILDYYRHPRNRGTVANAEISAEDNNPLCGDTIKITAKVNEGKIAEIKFDGQGCAISQAATSMLTEHMQGKDVSEAKRLSKKDILAMLNIPISPVRLKCALLGLKVLKMGAYIQLGTELSREEAEAL